MGLPRTILSAGADLDRGRCVDTGGGIDTGTDRIRGASDAGITVWDFLVRFFLQVHI